MGWASVLGISTSTHTSGDSHLPGLLARKTQSLEVLAFPKAAQPCLLGLVGWAFFESVVACLPIYFLGFFSVPEK